MSRALAGLKVRRPVAFEQVFNSRLPVSVTRATALNSLFRRKHDFTMNTAHTPVRAAARPAGAFPEPSRAPTAPRPPLSAVLDALRVEDEQTRCESARLAEIIGWIAGANRVDIDAVEGRSAVRS